MKKFGRDRKFVIGWTLLCFLLQVKCSSGEKLMIDVHEKKYKLPVCHTLSSLMLLLSFIQFKHVSSPKLEFDGIFNIRVGMEIEKYFIHI